MQSVALYLLLALAVDLLACFSPVQVEQVAHSYTIVLEYDRVLI